MKNASMPQFGTSGTTLYIILLAHSGGDLEQKQKKPVCAEALLLQNQFSIKLCSPKWTKHMSKCDMCMQNMCIYIYRDVYVSSPWTAGLLMT